MKIYLVMMGDNSVWWYTSKMRYFVSRDQARKYAQELNNKLVAIVDGTIDDLDEYYQVWEVDAGEENEIQ